MFGATTGIFDGDFSTICYWQLFRVYSCTRATLYVDV